MNYRVITETMIINVCIITVVKVNQVYLVKLSLNNSHRKFSLMPYVGVGMSFNRSNITRFGKFRKGKMPLRGVVVGQGCRLRGIPLYLEEVTES